MLKTRKKRGQSTLEYILLLTGVLVIMIVFLGPSGIFATRYNTVLQTGTDGMSSMATSLSGSRGNGT
jgi:uncharacterized protein (UPF0333 family)